MDTSFIEKILSNQGLSVLLILGLILACYKSIPKLFSYWKEREEVKYKMDREREERYQLLVDEMKRDAQMREEKLNELVKEMNDVNVDLTKTNKESNEIIRELAQSNKMLVDGIIPMIKSLESKMDVIIQEKNEDKHEG